MVRVVKLLRNFLSVCFYHALTSLKGMAMVGESTCCYPCASSLHFVITSFSHPLSLSYTVTLSYHFIGNLLTSAALPLLLYILFIILCFPNCHSKFYIHIFITVVIHSFHVTDISNFYCSFPRQFTFIPCPSLSCKYQCWCYCEYF